MADINVDEVLKEYGLEDLVEESTVVQSGNQTIVIPSDNTNNVSPIGEADVIIEESNVEENVLLEEDNTDFALREIFGPTGQEQVTIVNRTDTSIYTSDNNYNSVEPETTISTITMTTTPQPSQPVQVEAEHPTEDKSMSIDEALGLLPVNSKSLEIDESTSRFSGATWYKAIQESTVIVAGIGGIGSNLLYPLSRMKPKQVVIYDDDDVEMANLSGQLYSTEMIGKKKVNAMSQFMGDFSSYFGVVAIPERFTDKTPAGDIMICGFDNMVARTTFFGVWLNHVVKSDHKENCLFIDGRLGMESFQVFCIRGDDTFNIRRYREEFLFDDWEAEEVQCSMKQTTYCANMIGSVMVNLFTNFISNTLNPIIPRDLPFKTYYDASIMYFKTES